MKISASLHPLVLMCPLSWLCAVWILPLASPAWAQVPSTLHGKIISVVIPGGADKRESATFDATHTYFTESNIPEPYSYQIVSSNQFRVVNFDPNHPAEAWSHLLFTLTEDRRGTIYDEDEQEFFGGFVLEDVVVPAMTIIRLSDREVRIGVKATRGQLVYWEESMDGVAWTRRGGQVMQEALWEITVARSEVDRTYFFRARTPTP